MGYIDPAPSITNPTAIAQVVPVQFLGNERGVRLSELYMDNNAVFEDGTDGLKIFGRMYAEPTQLSSALGAVLTGTY